MIKMETKNGYTITCTDIFSNDTVQPTYNDIVSIYSPEIKVGIDLFMTMDTAMIRSDNFEIHKKFSRYWDEKDFNSTIDEVEQYGGLAVIFESISLLRSFLEDCCQPLPSDASKKHTA